MKSYTLRYKIKDNSKVLGYQFIIKISLIPKLYQLEVQKMNHLIDKEADKNGWSYLNVVQYAYLEEDCRSNKFIPKGYRSFRFMFTHSSNIIRPKDSL